MKVELCVQNAKIDLVGYGPDATLVDLLEAVETNLFKNDGVHLEINGHKIKTGERAVAGELCKSRLNEINIKKGKLNIAKIIVDLRTSKSN